MFFEHMFLGPTPFSHLTKDFGHFYGLRFKISVFIIFYLCILFFRTSEAKLNNFTRLEPSLHLLDIPFDTQVVRERGREGERERGREGDRRGSTCSVQYIHV